MATINLYPPVVDTYMPAFLIEQNKSESKNICRVYFSLSLYNSSTDIANVQVTVTNQNTNISALDTYKYPTGIMLTKLQTDLTRASNDRYFIEITPSDIDGGAFEINKYYKVQLRFTSTEAGSVNLTIPQAIDHWLNTKANLSEFSEWSTVCLVRGISVPYLNIVGLDKNADETILTSTLIDIIGKLTFEDPTETDYLKNYQIKIYNSEKELVIDSGLIYTDSYRAINEINYAIKQALKDGEVYTLEIAITTYNLYTETTTFVFTVLENGIEKIEGTITALPEEENGRIGIRIVGNSMETFLGNITIRRASSKDDFNIWEDVTTFTLKEGSYLDTLWYDYTVESGVWYKYGMQKRDSIGTRGVITTIKDPVMIMFEDMFLNAEGVQLKIKYNPNVSSMKQIVMDSKTDTIGSKYPFVKRNAYTDYKQFPISGLITYFTDDNNIFTSKEEIFKDSLNLYKDYNWENRITDYNDHLFHMQCMRMNIHIFLNLVQELNLYPLT